jgi:hypothetical protein
MSDSDPIGIADRSPQKISAVVALIQSGVTHYTAIARATGLTEEEVRRIDEAKDEHVRELALRGTGRDVYYHLRSKITCPRCGSIVYLVPCVACTVAKSTGHSKNVTGRPRFPQGRAVFPAELRDQPSYPEEQHHGS